MDSPRSPRDSTAVLRMQKDFNDFLASSTQSKGVTHRFSFSNTSSTSPVEDNALPVLSMMKLKGNPDETRLKEAELLKSKSLITQLESEVSSLRTSKKRSRIEFDRDIENIKREHKKEQEQLYDMKQQIRHLTLREESARNELHECRKALEVTKASYEEKLCQAHRDVLQADAKLQEYEQNSHAENMDLKNEIKRLSAELSVCQNSLQDNKIQLKNTLRRCTEVNQQLQDLEEYRMKAVTAEHKIKDLEMAIQRHEEESIIVKTMKSQIDRVPSMEAENRKLKEENQYLKNTQENSFLLNEEVRGLKAKLSRAEERCEAYTRCKLQVEELQMKLKDWESLDIGQGSKSPHLVNRHLKELQSTNLMLLEKQGHLQSSVATAEQTMGDYKHKFHTCQEQLAKEMNRNSQQQEMIKRLQRKLQLVARERNSYKEILDTYEGEATINIAGMADKRIQKLEDIAKKYREELDRLEKCLSERDCQVSEYKTKAELLEERLENMETEDVHSSVSVVDQKIVSDLRNQVAELQALFEKTRDEKEILEARIEQRHLQGDYDPTKTKVITLKMNPMAIALEKRANELKNLKEENERLKQRLSLLEETGGSVEDLTVKVEHKLQEPSSSKEVEDMKFQLQSAELKNKRLMEVFTKKSHEFREVCYQLLGYRIDIPRENHYRLMNMYADSPDDFLLFQQAENGDMQMLSTDYSSAIEDKIATYLSNEHSIPALLSSVTLDLHNQQTMMAS